MHRVATAVLALASASLVASCAPREPDVRFELGKPIVKVDSSGISYLTSVEQPIVAMGKDSAKAFVVITKVRDGVSMRAGQKPVDGHAFTVVTSGSGSLFHSAYASKCDQWTKVDCLNAWIDPEFSFSITGYVPLRDLKVTP